LVKVLKGIPVRLVALDILHQCDYRHTGLQGLGKRWHKQGCRGTVLGCDDTDPAGNTGVPVGHRAAHIFLPVSDLSNADRLGGENDGRWKALAENQFHVVAAKSLRDTLRNGFDGFVLRH
jgi:hypothetical protein